MPQRSQHILIIALLLLAPLLTFGACVGHEFVSWDDGLNIYNNPNLNPVTPASFKRIWTQPYEALYIPFSYTAWAAVTKVAHLPQAMHITGGEASDLNPHVFHAFNLLLHLASVLVVWLILRGLVEDARACAAGALLFALHPIQTEAVVWISGMRDVLGGLLSFLAIWLYLLFAQADAASRRRWWHYAGATLCFVLALLTKPSAVTLPLAMWAIDRWCVGRSARAATVCMLPWMLLAVPLVLVARGSQPVDQSYVVPLLYRPLIMLDALSFYLRQLVLPRTLVIDYGRHPAYVLTQTPAQWCVTAVPYLIMIALMVARRWRTWMTGALAVFTAALLPVLGLVPFVFSLYSTVADRYAYVPLLGAAMAVAYGLRGQSARPVWIACGAVLVALMAKSTLQTRTWRNTFTLFEYTARANPTAYISYMSLGMAHLKEGHRLLSLDYYHKASELNPDSWQSWMGLAEGHAEMDPAQAVQDYSKALALMEKKGAPPDQVAGVHNNTALLLERLRKFAEAEEHLRTALRLAPGFAMAANNLQQLQRMRAEATPAHEAFNEGNRLAQAGQYAQAVAKYREAVKLDPRYVAAFENMGVVLLRDQKQGEAVQAWQQALRIKPDSVGARVGLGDLALGQSKYAEAIRDYQVVLSIRPEMAGVRFNLGVALDKAGRRDAARAQWQAALEVDPGFTPARRALQTHPGNGPTLFP